MGKYKQFWIEKDSPPDLEYPEYVFVWTKDPKTIPGVTGQNVKDGDFMHLIEYTAYGDLLKRLPKCQYCKEPCGNEWCSSREGQS